MFRLNCQHIEADTYIAKTDSDEIVLECLCVSNVSSCTIFFLGGKAARALSDHPLPSRVDEKERVAIRLLTLWTFRICSVVKVAFTFTILLLLFLFLLFYFAAWLASYCFSLYCTLTALVLCKLKILRFHLFVVVDVVILCM